MTILVNDFSEKKTGSTTIASFNVLGIIKGYNPEKTRLAKYSGQLWHIEGVGTQELTISKVGHIGLLKTTNFTIS